jgi:hypothetical protein
MYTFVKPRNKYSALLCALSLGVCLLIICLLIIYLLIYQSIAVDFTNAVKQTP